MLRKGHGAKADDVVTAEEEIKDPFVLEFLDLRTSTRRAIWKLRSSRDWGRFSSS